MNFVEEHLICVPVAGPVVMEGETVVVVQPKMVVPSVAFYSS